MEWTLSWAQSPWAVPGWICDPRPARPCLCRAERERAGLGQQSPFPAVSSSGSSFPGLEGDGKDTALPTPSSRQGPRQGSGIPVPLLSHLTGPRARFRAVRTEVMDWS